MPDGKRRSLRRSGPVGALVFVCVACVVPISHAASSPAPDPPPLAVAPDPQPAKPEVVSPREPREAPVVVRQPVVQSEASPQVATAAPAPGVQKPNVVQRRRPVKKQPAAKKPVQEQGVATPAWVVTPSHTAPREAWPVQRAGVAVPEAEVLQRRRFALAGVVLALVAVGGGVLLGVGGRTLKEATQ